MRTIYRTGAHPKHRLLFHIVFIPKYRKRVLQFELAKWLRELMSQGCQMNDWAIHRLGIEEFLWGGTHFGQMDIFQKQSVEQLKQQSKDICKIDKTNRRREIMGFSP